MTPLQTRGAVIFAAFAAVYFLSALLRAVTATLAPVFSVELGLQAADLGLLAGAYFLGFALLQLPLGRALDRFGPRRTLLCLLGVAVLGCAAFAMAPGFPALFAARMLIGAGVSAALMAPLTCYRRLFSPAAQLRANSWMLMTGSLGMVASTLPVQMLLPVLGWRGLFWALAALLLGGLGLVAWLVPRDQLVVAATPAGTETLALSEPSAAAAPAPAGLATATATAAAAAAAAATATPEAPAASAVPTANSVAVHPACGYASIVRHPLFVRVAPMGFFVYGGLIAVQSLWAGPWLTRVSGWTAAQAAQGLFAINLCMLVAFFAWGVWMPRLARRGITPVRLMRWGVLLPPLLLLGIVALGARAGAAHWALWCVSCTFASVSQPAVGAAFAPALAGRALSAFNLVIFGGVFCLQWGIGVLIDLLRQHGLAEADAYRVAFGAFALCCAASHAWFLGHAPDGVAAHKPRR